MIDFLRVVLDSLDKYWNEMLLWFIAINNCIFLAQLALNRLSLGKRRIEQPDEKTRGDE